MPTITHLVHVVCLHITPRVFFACLPQRWYNLHDPTPSSGTGNCYKWRPWALQCRGEWHSQGHLLLFPPIFSSTACYRVWVVFCIIAWFSGFCSLSLTNGVYVRWYLDVVFVIDTRYNEWTHRSSSFHLTMHIVCHWKRNSTIETRAPTCDTILEIIRF